MINYKHSCCLSLFDLHKRIVFISMHYLEYKDDNRFVCLFVGIRVMYDSFQYFYFFILRRVFCRS